MWVCGCKIPNASSSYSLGTSFKHFPVPKRTALNPHSYVYKCLTTAKIRDSLHFQTLSPRQKDQISIYVDALLQWNQRMNLTAAKEVNEIMERHVEDSLALLPPVLNSYALHCGSSWENINLVDVGSGAGLPGMILAIARPDWRVTLLESLYKRCTFLEHTVGLTGLPNVQIIRGRAEDFGQKCGFRQVYDIAVARAVAEMRILAEYCLPLVRVGGLFIAAKGYCPEEEVKKAERGIHILGGSVLQLCSVESHGPYGQRTAIVCLKRRPTPRRYPRASGTPGKLPL